MAQKGLKIFATMAGRRYWWMFRSALSVEDAIEGGRQRKRVCFCEGGVRAPCFMREEKRRLVQLLVTLLVRGRGYRLLVNGNVYGRRDEFFSYQETVTPYPTLACSRTEQDVKTSPSSILGWQSCNPTGIKLQTNLKIKPSMSWRLGQLVSFVHGTWRCKVQVPGPASGWCRARDAKHVIECFRAEWLLNIELRGF